MICIAENDEVTPSQNDVQAAALRSGSTNSKDLQLIPRLAACLHIFNYAFQAVLQKKRIDEFPEEIPLEILRSVENFMGNCIKQKTMLFEAVTGTNKAEEKTLAKPIHISHRIWKKIASHKGPLITPREIYKNVHGVNATMAKTELQLLESKGFGKFLQKGGEIKHQMFMKPHPTTIREDCPYVNTTLVTFDSYRAMFNDMSTTSDEDLALCRRFHPHSEILDLTPSTQDSQETVSMEQSQNSIRSSQPPSTGDYDDDTDADRNEEH